MAWVEIVTALALLQYITLGFKVGQARGKYDVKAPAVTGAEGFERAYRVQMNTLELMVMFIPALWMAAQHVAPSIAAGIGVIYLIGRILYARAYVADPAKRGPGFILSLGPTMVLVIIALVGALLDVF